jgi:hypothetical protein
MEGASKELLMVRKGRHQWSERNLVSLKARNVSYEIAR